MKVALLTMFNGLDSTYSLVNVVAEQLRMMLDARLEPTLLVSEHCPLDNVDGVFQDKRIKWQKVVNSINGKQIHWKDYSQPDGKVHSTFFDEANVIAEDLVAKLADVDVCIMHDIHYQGWHLVHNVAIRMAQEKLPRTKFIAFTHSAPANRPLDPKWPFSARYTEMPNTIYVYPTQSGLAALAKQYNVPEGRCRVVNNSLDLLSFTSNELHALTNEVDLQSPDILIIYPGRLTTGKRFDKVAMLGGAIKKACEKSVKVIFCDFPSSDISSKDYKSFIRAQGSSFGLKLEDMFFTSDIKEFKNGFPRKSVLELFSLSNLFICPSYSESFGLTILEAASKGNFLVLNERVPALEELGKNLNSYFLKWDARNFGFDTHETYHPSEQAYLSEHGQIIVNKMQENPVIQAKTLARQRYSPKWIWENQLEPLISFY
ncbi:glycosyltransferase [Neobacillus cucumis]|uniref:glycosyltransferase n=1 Tax=Neobacillus cucumis TaxID=1740721 RepID=UPI001EF92335|nr:glycosyltransferase [Neobacillus cucumis]MBM7653824.1 glycosyltransferase involved in cell wall biosynthesis [Neobacillus cucumis]